MRAAADAFDRSGYNGVNLKEVVEELGLTKGALYYFFPTKESLAAEIVHRHTATFEDLASEALTDRDDLLDALIDIGRRLADKFATDSITRAGTRLATERSLINIELPEPFVEWINRITALLSDAQKKGQVRAEVDAPAAAQMMVSYFYGAQTLSGQFSNHGDLRERVEAFWAMAEPWLRAA